MTAIERVRRLEPLLGSDILNWDVRPHECPTMVYITRDGGGKYETDGLLFCSCTANKFGNKCSHLKAVERWGGIKTIVKALEQ